MSTDRKSRRAVLATALGVAGAAAAGALAGPAAALAADGETIQVGGLYEGTAVTRIMTGTSSAIQGRSGSFDGLEGLSDTGVGVFAQSKTLPGDTAFQGKIGLRAQSFHDTGAIGVLAESYNGQAVRGVDSGSGTGGYFTSSSGVALRVAGKAAFSRSGRATVLKSKSYVDIAVAGGLTSHSVVHATLQSYRAGVAIAAVRVNYPSTGKARIYLTKVASTTSSTYVGWFVAEY